MKKNAAAGAILVLLLGALGISEFVASSRRALAGEGSVDVDVPAARDAVANALLRLEASCARIADEALDAASNTSEITSLFAALEELPLPADAGVRLLDRDGRLLAWTGASLGDPVFRDLPRAKDGGIFLASPTARHVAVIRRVTSPLDGVAVIAVAYRPIEIHYPSRSPFLRSTSLAESVAREHRVATIEILSPDGDDLRGVALPSGFGGDLARLVVPPVSPEVWREGVDADAAARRAAIVSVLAAFAAVLAMAAAGRTRTSLRTWLLRALVLVALRAVLGAVSLGGLIGGEIANPGVYAAGLPLGWNATPLALLLTALAAAGVAGCLAAAAGCARRRPLPGTLFLVVTAAVALACRVGIGSAIEDVVWNSTTRFFPADSVLPPVGPAALIVAITASAFVGIALLHACGRLFAPEGRQSVPLRLVAALAGACVLMPLGATDTPTRPGLVVVGLLGATAALAAITVGRGLATRAAVIPLGLALAILPALQHQLDASLRADLADVAMERADEAASSREQADVLFVDRVLDGLESSPGLRAALSGRRWPGDLAARMWSASALSGRTGASGLEILELETVDPDALPRRQSFSADLPPRTWMPAPNAFAGPRTRWTETVDGRGPGRDSRWVVGETPIEIAGAVPASVRVWLELRPPLSVRLLALDEAAARPSTTSRTLRTPTMDRYDVLGYVEADRAENPFTPLGLRLDPDVRDAVLAGGGQAWRETEVGGRAYLVYVLPSHDDSGTVNGALAFSATTIGPREVVLRSTKAALCGALLAVLALLATSPWWARGARLRLSHRLVLSYVLVSAVPLMVLAWANGELVQQRDDKERLRQLREAVTVLSAALQDPLITARLAEIDPGDLERQGAAVIDIPDPAYHPGRRGNVYLGARLAYSTDQGLLDTELLPTRMPGRAYHEVVLLRRAFHVEAARAGEHTVNVGYAPLRNPASPRNEVIGAVAVTMVHEREVRDAEQAAATTAVLGFYLASLVAVMGMGAAIAERLTSPLRALRLATHRVAAGDLSEPVDSAGPGELGQVVAAFNSMMADLSESREKLVKAEKEAAWRDMARQVAHEVKNPLTPMRLAAEHLRRAHADDSPQFASILERSVGVIIRQTENLRRIVTDFRDFARMPVQRREPVDLSAALSEVLDLYRGVPGLEVNVDVVPSPPAVLADPDEMRRVLVNLAGNAVEALDGRPGRLDGRVVVDATHVVVTIEDDGPGIEPSALPRLFEPNFSTKTGGTGLGLAICKRAVDDLGGEIRVESTLGRGTRVTMRLPVASGRDHSA